MNAVNLFDVESTAIRDLMELVQRRHAAETACAAVFQSAKQDAKRELLRSRKHIEQKKAAELTSLSSAWETKRRQISEKFTSDQAAADRSQSATMQESHQRAKADGEKTQVAYSDALWTADSLHEAAEKQASDQRSTLERKSAGGLAATNQLREQIQPWLQRAQLLWEDLAGSDPQVRSADSTTALDYMEVELSNAEGEVTRLQELRILRYTGIRGIIAWAFAFVLLGAIPVFFITPRLYPIFGGLAFAILATLLAHWLTRRTAKRQASQIATSFRVAIERAALAQEQLAKHTTEEYRRAIAEAARLRDERRQKAQEHFPPVLAKIADRETREVAAAADKHERDSEKIRTWNYQALTEAETYFAPTIKACEERFGAELAKAEATYVERKKTARAERDRAWGALCQDWRAGQDRLGNLFNHLKVEGMENCPDWDSPVWLAPSPVERVAEGIRFGDISIDLSQIPNGVPEHEDLEPTIPFRMRLPAFLPFPTRCSLLLRTRDDGRPKAVEALQSAMLRFLTAVPAGKVRFTVLDPVGLGANFASFMHLADFEESLINSRIWTEQQQIEKRLADLTAHMEMVIQKYLRNQYRTIEEYNAQAGEVAEPFRVLVIADFPVNFSLEAARRLVSIVNNGSACGVFTLMSVDTSQPMPQGFNLADLEQGSLTLTWKNGEYVWKEPVLPFPIVLEKPPDADDLVRLVRIIGERGRDAGRVEVPFTFVAPGPQQMWARDSRKGITVPIGRAGATKQQLFEVGKGTAQHSLIAGKTGSGKSTLLHVLITNLALHYSPDEVELYLIDFKKGVEFKPYAVQKLPHARVIAIESEREFGLSVLQRLDAELKARGDRFRDAGANDLAGYRDATNERCPRIMLVVDEFQEFFVEDDRLAQESALLLDRLVRQGRAFGLHIVLGSQTLGGAYSLARSTIDQMAIRVALQCSDADAQLILSKDNTAARLLSRPGEAIYNDANGLVEGNDLFQIVWITDHQREEILREIARETERVRGVAEAPLVFEGNIDSSLADNTKLREVLASPTAPTSSKGATIWLGDAVAIKDPTAAMFRHRSGSNLLLVGQHEQGSVALFGAAMLSLAAQNVPNARFLILDGTPDDDPHAGYLGRIAEIIPHRIQFLDSGLIPAGFASLAGEVNERVKGTTVDRTPIYLFVVGLHRFRELRKEDDFGFGRRGADKPVPPSELFATIFRDGPPVGVHTMVWCDGLTNLNRAIDRQGLREFGQRVLFQMNANDSSALVDSPAASRLGQHRALYIAEEMTQPEKFRPYGIPNREWLNTVRNGLRAKETSPHGSE